MNIKDTKPLLAVDSFSVDVKTGHKYQHHTMKTYKIPVADVRFLINRDDDTSEVVAAVRLTNHQLRELLETLETKLDEFSDNSHL
jgi:hypothetical protein